MSQWTTKFLALSLSTGIITAALLQAPAPVLASMAALPCSNTTAQYYTSLVPFFNTHTRQVTLVDPKTYHVAQVMADKVDNADAMYYNSSWSTSCRYYAFSVGNETNTDTYLWDTVTQKQAGTYHRAGQFDPSDVQWSPDDSYAVVENFLGEFLWKVGTSQQFQLNDIPTWVWWSPFAWDLAHGQALLFDGSYMVAYDLNSGKAIRKYASPFDPNRTNFELSADGRTLRLWDPELYKWSISYDRASGAVVDAYAILDRSAGEVQISPDHRYIAIAGPGVYDTQMISYYGWYPIVSLIGGLYTVHFIDSSTLELDYNGTTAHRIIDMKTVPHNQWPY